MSVFVVYGVSDDSSEGAISKERRETLAVEVQEGEDRQIASITPVYYSRCGCVYQSQQNLCDFLTGLDAQNIQKLFVGGYGDLWTIDVNNARRVADVINRAPRLEEIFLGDVFQGPIFRRKAAFQAFAEALNVDGSIKRFHLIGCRYSNDEYAPELALIFEKLRGLEFIDMPASRFSFEGDKGLAFAQAMAANKNLKSVTLFPLLNFSEEGAANLRRAFDGHPSLRAFALSLDARLKKHQKSISFSLIDLQFSLPALEKIWACPMDLLDVDIFFRALAQSPRLGQFHEIRFNFWKEENKLITRIMSQEDIKNRIAKIRCLNRCTDALVVALEAYQANPDGKGNVGDYLVDAICATGVFHREDLVEYLSATDFVLNFLRAYRPFRPVDRNNPYIQDAEAQFDRECEGYVRKFLQDLERNPSQVIQSTTLNGFLFYFIRCQGLELPESMKISFDIFEMNADIKKRFQNLGFFYLFDSAQKISEENKDSMMQELGEHIQDIMEMRKEMRVDRMMPFPQANTVADVLLSLAKDQFYRLMYLLDMLSFCDIPIREERV